MRPDHDCSPDCLWPGCPGRDDLYLVDPDGHPLEALATGSASGSEGTNASPVVADTAEGRR